MNFIGYPNQILTPYYTLFIWQKLPGDTPLFAYCSRFLLKNILRGTLVQIYKEEKIKCCDVCTLWLIKISSQELNCTLCNLIRYLSKELACASLIIETVTMGGDMWTWSLVPTSRRTVAEKRVLVFKTYVNEINLKESFTLPQLVDFISILITLIRR